MTMRRVVFFGSGPLALRLLAHALKMPHLAIIGVVTAPVPTRGHHSQQSSPIIELALSRKIPVFQPAQADEIIEQITGLNPDAGLLLAYGKLLPESVLNCFPHGIVNIHPSLLPLYRGPSPIEATILNGDNLAGPTLMIIDRAMDAGPILAQEAFPISSSITKPELTEQLISTAERLLDKHLIAYINGDITPTTQPSTPAARYCHMIKKSDGDTELTQVSAIELTRRTRAYASWPSVRVPINYKGINTILTLHEVELYTSVEPSREPFAQVHGDIIAATQNGFIKLITVQLAGKPRISGRDLWNGGKIAPATD